MLDKLKHILKTNTMYQVVGVSLIADVPRFYVLVVKVVDDNLDVVSKSEYDSFELLVSKLDKSLPLLLHFEGNNIINKAVDFQKGYRNNLIFNANLDDFYFYEYKQNQTVYVSVVRKALIDDYITRFLKSNIYTIHISFGPFVLANILEMLSSYNNVSTFNNCIELSDGFITSFESLTDKKQNNYTLNNEQFNQNTISLLAAFFDYKYQHEHITFDTDFLNENASEFQYSKWFKIVGVSALVITLLTLFISHNLNGYYLKSLAEKESLYNIAQQNALSISNLKQEIALKERILIDNRINNNDYITKYIADIGNSILKKITLKDIAVFPIQKKIRSNEKVNFESSVIIVKGQTYSDEEFNKWIVSLKQLQWIKSVDIVGYNESKKALNTFKLKIAL